MIGVIQYKNNSNINFGAKIPTKNAIEIATERFLTGEGIAPIHKATCTMMSRPTDMLAKDTIDLSSENREFIGALNIAKQMLVKQFPVFEDVIVQAERFFDKQKRSTQETAKWLDMQVKKIGSENIDIKPIKITNSELQKAAE